MLGNEISWGFNVDVGWRARCCGLFKSRGRGLRTGLQCFCLAVSAGLTRLRGQRGARLEVPPSRKSEGERERDREKKGRNSPGGWGGESSIVALF
ncbi:hypothetical protein MHYP_G00342910 [Metynnis hypsauchen]